MQKGYTDLDSLIIPTTIVDALRLLFPIDATTIIHQIEINLLTDHTACTVQLKIDETMCVCMSGLFVIVTGSPNLWYNQSVYGNLLQPLCVSF